MLNPLQFPFTGPFTQSLRTTMSKQSAQALELNQKAVEWQLEQLSNADKMVREQAANAMKSTIDAWRTSTEMMLDIQRKSVEAMTPPAETEAN